MILGWITGITGIVVAIWGYRLYRQKEQLAARLAAQEREVQHQQEQLSQLNSLLKMKILQARLNPHFLFNSLNAIQYFISADDRKTSLQYVSRFSAFLRKMVHYGDEISIHLQDEAELIRDYLVLEQFRFPDRFEYDIDLPEALCLEDIPPFLTHGLLEEALYKGVLHLGKEEKGKISVTLRAKGETLELEVTDNGMSGEFSPGMDEGERAVLFNHRIAQFNALNHRQIQLEQRSAVHTGNGRLNRAMITIR
ncbi:histidine kinase [Chitinophaga sp. GCM10012297]|uniref:Histidine kinase n=1 Tax=Chitinophaga chungangae TaxID=2821488 RepID=A0ABS3YC35_9BACT|nr:histidine kinase [Chitinophaga chungangae]MBO9152234.1 histidine kinase [Chitinophaga chungangae]